MYAVIETGGQQFKVKTEQTLDVEKLDGEVGSKVVLDKVLLIKTDDDVKMGTPYIDKAKVTCEIVVQDRGKKIKVFKFKRRKGYKKMQGHRQHFTKIKIDSIDF
jgi:large subunit ribosomal protein L21